MKGEQRVPSTYLLLIPTQLKDKQSRILDKMISIRVYWPNNLFQTLQSQQNWLLYRRVGNLNKICSCVNRTGVLCCSQSSRDSRSGRAVLWQVQRCRSIYKWKNIAARAHRSCLTYRFGIRYSSADVVGKYCAFIMEN